ncbi:MAG: nucleoside-triphosphatase, partial [Clostridiales bacterium]
MHIFLTGEIQCGKTTIIHKVLALLPQIKATGCCTFSLPLPDGTFAVHLGYLNAPPPEAGDESTMVGLRLGQGGYRAYPAVFETWGVAVIANLGTPDVIVLDDLGGMENQAPRFQQAVLQLLEGDIPVLGVIKPRSLPLPDAVRTHPRVEVITGTVENRDD